MRIHKDNPRRFEDLPQQVQTICTSLLDGLRATIGENLYGVYLYGAMVFAETRYINDIDFCVIVKKSLTAHENEEIKHLHNKLADEFPPLGAELDGHYILLEDSRQASAAINLIGLDILDEWWPLHRAHMIAGYCIILYGPDPRRIFPAPTWLELVAVLEVERRYIQKHLSEYPSYCVLNLCRLIYTYSMEDVVISKQAAAEWVLNRFPTWGRLVEAAFRVYAREDEEEDRCLLESETERFYEFACDRIEESKTK